MIGKFYPFDPKGSQFYYPEVEPTKPPPPSKISLQQLSVGPGDYVGLRGTGSWRATKNATPLQRMSGMFRSSKGSPLAPAGSRLLPLAPACSRSLRPRKAI